MIICTCCLFSLPGRYMFLVCPFVCAVTWCLFCIQKIYDTYVRFGQIYIDINKTICVFCSSYVFCTLTLPLSVAFVVRLVTIQCTTSTIAVHPHNVYSPSIIKQGYFFFFVRTQCTHTCMLFPSPYSLRHSSCSPYDQTLMLNPDGYQITEKWLLTYIKVEITRNDPSAHAPY